MILSMMLALATPSKAPVVVSSLTTTMLVERHRIRRRIGLRDVPQPDRTVAVPGRHELARR